MMMMMMIQGKHWDHSSPISSLHHHHQTEEVTHSRNRETTASQTFQLCPRILCTCPGQYVVRVGVGWDVRPGIDLCREGCILPAYKRGWRKVPVVALDAVILLD